MKISIIKKARRLSLAYKLLLCGLFLSQGLVAQSIKRNFTKVVEVPNNVTVVSNSPRAMSMEMNGTISSTTKNDNYQLTTGLKKGSPTLMIKEYVVNTWDKNTVEQQVEISITPDEKAPQEGEQLLDALAIEFSQTDHRIKIDANMNIEKFIYSSSWFSGKKMTIGLENGAQYRFKNMTIKTTLNIPKSANLEVNSEYVGLLLGDLSGTVTLGMNGANVTAGDVGSLDLDLVFSKASFNKIGEASVNTRNAEFKAKEIDHLEIGARSFNNKSMQSGLFSESTNSALSKYNVENIQSLNIVETANDEFNLGTVEALTVRNSAFSNYSIKSLLQTLSMKIRNGDLMIEEVGKNFSTIDINNRISSIELGLSKVENYLVEINNKRFTELHFPANLKLQDPASSHQPKYLKGNSKNAASIKLRCDSCEFKILDSSPSH